MQGAVDKREKSSKVEKSILDYVLINAEDEDLVESMVIDEDREITPSYRRWKKHLY